MVLSKALSKAAIFIKKARDNLLKALSAPLVT